MVFFLGSLISNYSLKLDHHHHHQQHKKLSSSSKMLSTSLHKFESEISTSLFQLLNSSNHSDQNLSTTFIQNCINILLPNMNRAFKILISDIDYPITNWEMNSIDEYLNYTLNSMEFLNSITSSITHLSQTLMTLSHALSLTESSSSPNFVSKSLKPIKQEPWSSSKKNLIENQEKLKFGSEKEWIIHQALKVKESVWYWVYIIVESSFHGDMKLDMENELWVFSSELVNLQLSSVYEKMSKKKSNQIREVINLNKTLVEVIVGINERVSEEQETNDEVNELKGNLEELRKMMDDIKEDISKLFSEVLLGRKELLDSFQQRKIQNV